MVKQLTPKQEKFAQCVASGMTQADAYREAYSASKMKDKSIIETASQLMSNINVSSRVAELREITTTSAVLSISERKEWITKLIQAEEGVFNGDKLRALDILNKMDGAYAPEKREHSGEVGVRAITRKVVD